MFNAHTPVILTSLLSVLFGFTAALAQAESYAAVLHWSKRVELSTPNSGVVHKVLVDAGERVKKDAVLLELDDQVFKAAVDAANAALRGRDVIYQEVKRELDRTTELYNRTLLSEHELQVAKNNFMSAEAELTKAKSASIQAKNALHYSRVRAPFNAIVLSRHVEPGKVIAAELKPDVLFVVVEDGRMLARMAIPESKLAALRKGNAVKVKVDKHAFNGTIKTIGLEPDTSSGDAPHYPVEVEFATGDVVLRAGMSAKVELP